MMLRFLTAATAALFAAAAPAAVTTRGTTTADGVMRYDARSGRFCLTERTDRTGTRLPAVTCKSADEWKLEGLTVARR